MVGFFVLAIVATPFVFAGWLLNRIFQHRAHMQQLQASRHAALPPAGYAPVDPDIEQRLRNLEAIVTSADYEFSERLREQRDPRAA